MGLFDRFLKRAAPEPAGPICDALVVYALPSATAEIAPEQPRFVSLRFDPGDARLILQAPDAPACKRGDLEQLRQRLNHATGMRDPNSAGRLRHLLDWLADHAPAHLAWRLETEADAAR